MMPFFSLGKMLPELFDLGKLAHNWHNHLRDIDYVMHTLVWYNFLGGTKFIYESILWIITTT